MFLSYGPKFLQQTEVEPFSNIELYNLMCGACIRRPALFMLQNDFVRRLWDDIKALLLLLHCRLIGGNTCL